MYLKYTVSACIVHVGILNLGLYNKMLIEHSPPSLLQIHVYTEALR